MPAAIVAKMMAVRVITGANNPQGNKKPDSSQRHGRADRRASLKRGLPLHYLKAVKPPAF
jgi:hypothetical protein